MVCFLKTNEEHVPGRGRVAGHGRVRADPVRDTAASAPDLVPDTDLGARDLAIDTVPGRVRVIVVLAAHVPGLVTVVLVPSEIAHVIKIAIARTRKTPTIKRKKRNPSHLPKKLKRKKRRKLKPKLLKPMDMVLKKNQRHLLRQMIKKRKLKKKKKDHLLKNGTGRGLVRRNVIVLVLEGQDPDRVENAHGRAEGLDLVIERGPGPEIVKGQDLETERGHARGTERDPDPEIENAQGRAIESDRVQEIENGLVPGAVDLRADHIETPKLLMIAEPETKALISQP